MTEKEMLKIAVSALDSKKAQDIKVIEIGDLTIIADYFVIAAGTSSTQVRALAEEVEFQLEKAGALPPVIQGTHASGWIVLDYKDIIVHVFSREAREFYSLERLWADGKKIPVDEFIDKAE